MPADFERQSAILLGVNELLPHHPSILYGLFKELIHVIPLIAVITGEAQRWHLLATMLDWGLPADRIHCVSSPAIGLWVRDYGPSFIKREGNVCILDAQYHYPNRPDDDRFPSEFAKLLGVDVCDVPLMVEGGNVLSNGRGLGLCSTALMDRNAQKYQAKETLTLLSQYYGFKTLAGVRPLIGGPTAHADMFATFTSPDTLVVGQYRPADDPQNADLLDRCAKVLSGIETGVGPLKVERIPMPPHHDKIWRTYTNVLFANDVVVVPRYEGVDPSIERAAIDTYRRLLPDRKIVTVEATTLVKTGGAFRCVSSNVPDLGHSLNLG